MAQVKTKPINGINVEQLHETIETVKKDPQVALFRFRSHTDWIKGGRCKTTIKDFYGAKEEQKRKKPFVLEGDEPELLLGGDHAPNAVEAVLHALASCLTVGIVYNASARGIHVKSLGFDMEGEADLHRFLGLSETKRAGYKSIVVKIKADTNATKDEFRELVEYVKTTSPVMDIVQNPVPVSVHIA